MSTSELKKILIEKIDETNDEELLKAFYKILDFNSSPGDVFILNQEQKEVVALAQEQLKQGISFTNDEVEKESNQWLKK